MIFLEPPAFDLFLSASSASSTRALFGPPNPVEPDVIVVRLGESATVALAVPRFSKLTRSNGNSSHSMEWFYFPSIHSKPPRLVPETRPCWHPNCPPFPIRSTQAQRRVGAPRPTTTIATASSPRSVDRSTRAAPRTAISPPSPLALSAFGEGTELARLALVLQAADPGLSVLLVGPHGTGKSALVRAASQVWPMEPCTVLVPPGTTADRLVGAPDPLASAMEGRAVITEKGLLARASGGLLVLDDAPLLGDECLQLCLSAADVGKFVGDTEATSGSFDGALVATAAVDDTGGNGTDDDYSIWRDVPVRLAATASLVAGTTAPRTCEGRARAALAVETWAEGEDPPASATRASAGATANERAAARAAWRRADADLAARVLAARRGIEEGSVIMDDTVLETLCARAAEMLGGEAGCRGHRHDGEGFRQGGGEHCTLCGPGEDSEHRSQPVAPPTTLLPVAAARAARAHAALRGAIRVDDGDATEVGDDADAPPLYVVPPGTRVMSAPDVEVGLALAVTPHALAAGNRAGPSPPPPPPPPPPREDVDEGAGPSEEEQRESGESEGGSSSEAEAEETEGSAEEEGREDIAPEDATPPPPPLFTPVTLEPEEVSAEDPLETLSRTTAPGGTSGLRRPPAGRRKEASRGRIGSRVRAAQVGASKVTDAGPP